MTEDKKKKEQEEFDRLFDELFNDDSKNKNQSSTPAQEEKKDSFDDDFLNSLFDDNTSPSKPNSGQSEPKSEDTQEEKKEEKKEDDNFDWLKELIDEIDQEEREKKKKEQANVPAPVLAKPVKPSFTSKLKDKPRPPKPPEHIRMWGLGKKIVRMQKADKSIPNIKETSVLKRFLVYSLILVNLALLVLGSYHYFHLVRSTELCVNTDIILRQAYSGDKILIDTSVVSENGKKVIEQGYIDGQISNIMYHYLKQGEKVIDIGAGFGYHTLYLARIVGETGKVYSFEARKYMHELLDSSILINRLKNVQTFNTLLFSEDSKVMIDTNDHHKRSNFGVTNIVLQQDNIYSEEVSHEIANTRTLDSVLTNVTNISMININANGYELSIILGAKNIIANSPKIKIITTWSKYQIAKYVNIQNVIQNLLDNGFRFWLLKPSNGQLVPLTRLEYIMQVERGRFIIAKSLD